MQHRTPLPHVEPADSFGALLRQWRTQRGFSQLDLSLVSQVSQRHISFLESGRARPSRDMILALAAVLDVPLRQQNLMLTAAGFAPIHTEMDLSAAEMISVRKALDFMLHQQEPYPAFVVDRYWNLLLTNDAAARLIAAFVDLETLQAEFGREGKVSLIRAMFHPRGLRPYVVNWADIAGHLLQRVYREAMSTPHSSPSKATHSADGAEEKPGNEASVDQSAHLFEELLSYPDVSDIWKSTHHAAHSSLLLTVHLRRDGLDFEFFSTIATLGTAYDITLQELRIECLFPANELSEKNWNSYRLAASH